MDGAVVSRDGTRIAYERMGEGPAIILVGGGLTDRSENGPLVPALAPHFTVYNYDRRGRGSSGDTLPYAVEREIDDIDAVIVEAGGSAHLYGASSGGALALEVAAAGSAVNRVAVYEVPYNVAEGWRDRWQNYIAQLEDALARGDRGAAFALFLRVTGASDADIEGMQGSPMWPELEAVAHTLPYDARCLGTGQPPTDRLATITQPTLVLTGDDRPSDAAAWVLALDAAADRIAASIPRAKRDVLPGQSHVADPAVVADRLTSFFAG